MILIIDMTWKNNSLAFDEFVLPIVSVVKPLEKCTIKHFLEVNPQLLSECSKIILSGTALKDHATLRQVDKFSWVKTFDNPILGICAGIQTIASVFGESLTPCLKIGMEEITTQKANPLFEGHFKAYTLHNFSVEAPTNFEVLAHSAKCIQAVKHKQKNIYGVLFNPEVRNQTILENFVQLV